MSILVNDQFVDDQVIRDEARLLRARVREGMHGPADDLAVELEAREWARESVIMRVLLQQAAGAGSPDELLNQVMAKAARPTHAEVSAHYKRFPALYERPEMVRAAHIVKNVDAMSDEPAAELAMVEIERQLKGGAPFARLADLYSDCPGAGGDLGFFAAGEMVPEFERVVLSLRPGEVSGIFRTVFGFHIAKLTERRKAGIAPLREVRDQIEQDLWNQHKQQAVNDFMRKLRSQANIRKV